MKIINTAALSDGVMAFGLDKTLTGSDEAAFWVWAVKCNINEYLVLYKKYGITLLGVNHLPAILVKKNAPGAVKSLLLLAWE